MPSLPSVSHIGRYLPALALLLLIFIATAVSGCCGMTGCNLFNTQYTYINSYTVTVTGLSNYTAGSDGFRILLPVPMLNGTPAYTDDQIRSATLIFPSPVSVFADYQTVHESKLVNNTGWTASLVDTEHGPMIQLVSTNASLSDFMLIAGVNKEVPASERERYAGSSSDSPLQPVSSEPAGNYTVSAGYSNRNYSAYTFIDCALTPRPGQSSGNVSLSVVYKELFAEGSVPAYNREYQINESIPAGATGWIPVTVQK